MSYKIYIRWKVICEHINLSYTGESHSVFKFKEKRQALDKYSEKIKDSDSLNIYLAYYEEWGDGTVNEYSDRIIKEWNLYPEEIDNSHLFR